MLYTGIKSRYQCIVTNQLTSTERNWKTPTRLLTWGQPRSFLTTWTSWESHTLWTTSKFFKSRLWHTLRTASQVTIVDKFIQHVVASSLSGSGGHCFQQCEFINYRKLRNYMLILHYFLILTGFYSNLLIHLLSSSVLLMCTCLFHFSIFLWFI